MSKNRIIGTLLSVLVVMQVHSQSYFNQLNNVAFAHGKIIADQDYFYISGAVYNPSGSGSTVLSKYTTNGVHILSDTFSTDGIITMNGQLCLLENSIYLFNIVNEIIPYNAVNNNLQLTKLNKEFISDLSIPLGGTSEDNAIGILEHYDDLYLVGSTNSFGAGLGDFYLIKIDTNGNVLWEQTYGSSQHENAFSITPTQDGNLLLSGHKQIEGSDWDIYMVMVDTAGNQLWEKNYGTSWNDYGGRSTTTFDHSFIVYRNQHKTIQNTRSGFIEKLDSKGEIIWSKEFIQNDYSVFEFSTPIENEDGTIMVVNHVKNNEGKLIIKIHKLDPFGNTLWTKEYYTREDISQYIYDIKSTDDGGYVMCGSAFPLDTNIQHAWLIKTNCNGEEGVQHPLTTTPCDEYDCTLYPIDASFTASDLTIDLVDGGEVVFDNLSANTTSRVWDFGDGTKVYTDGQVTHTYTQEGIYDVQLIVFHATCSDTFSLQIEVTNTANITTHTALYELVKIYPNPNDGNFVLQNNTNQPLSIIITDALGKTIWQKTNALSQTNIALEVAFGVYTVSVFQNGSVVHHKIVVR
jgi:PKD repeat protein